MVTRGVGSVDNLRAINREVFTLTSGLTRSILPVLGLSAAFSILNGNVNASTSSGRAASSAFFEIEAATFALQEQITAGLLPVINQIAPALADALKEFGEFNEETNNLGLILAGIGVAAASGKARRLATLAGKGGYAAAAVGGGTAGAAFAAGVAANQSFDPDPARTRARREFYTSRGISPEDFADPDFVPPELPAHLRDPRDEQASSRHPVRQLLQGEESQPYQPPAPSGGVAGPTPTLTAPSGGGNTINIYSLGDEELIRRVRSIFEQGLVP